jgi:uncharacterized protein YjgD (DUF1641 family)
MSETLLSNAPRDEVERLAQAAREALTDSMVERLTTTSANALEVLDRFNDPDVKDAAIALLDRLGEMHRSGALKTLVDLVSALHAARDALTDSMVERLFGFFEHMVNNLATEELATLAHNARRAMEEAVDETAGRKPAGGILSALALLGDPQMQRSLQFIAAFGCKMQARAESLRGSLDIEEA